MIDTKSISIYVADEFNDVLVNAKKSNGDYSAEVFRDTILIPALKDNDEVIIIFTDVKELSKSFIHEVFSKLYRKGYTEEDLDTKLQIVSPNDKWTDSIYNSLEENSKGV